MGESANAAAVEIGPGDAPRLWARNDFTRAVHTALLIRFGVNETATFWARRPLDLGEGPLGPRALAEHLWQPARQSPVAWNMSVLNDLERFVFARNVTLPDFLDTTNHFANRGSVVQSRYLLAWLGPILVPMFRLGDPHRLLLHGAQLVSNRMSPGVTMKIIPWRGTDLTDRHRENGSIWTTYPGLGEGAIPAWDFPMQPGLGMMRAPRIFGLPPFESLQSICDAREPEAIPWGSACRREGRRFFIDGEPVGHAMRLSDHLRLSGYDPDQIAAPDVDVVVAERDYVCPQRQRVIVTAGCGYGAPGYLVRLAWERARPGFRNFLSFAHNEIAEDDSAEIETLHARYLDAVTEVIPVVFFEHEEAIEIRGQRICRGVPARILRECVAIARDEGRMEFTFRELKRRPGLVSHPKNTGFETRLARLRESLDAAAFGVTIRQTGRGRFALVCSGRLTLSDAR
jgi:hypothetical protein